MTANRPPRFAVTQTCSRINVNIDAWTAVDIGFEVVAVAQLVSFRVGFFDKQHHRYPRAFKFKLATTNVVWDDKMVSMTKNWWRSVAHGEG